MLDAESVRYDRQIRLWGHSTQKRLSNCHVDFFRFVDASPEIAKNLVLSGIRSATVLDDDSIDSIEYTQNFLIQRSATGERRDSVAQRALLALNPHVKIYTKAEDVKVAAATRIAIFQVNPNFKELLARAAIGDSEGYDIVCICVSGLPNQTLCLFLYRKAGVSLEAQAQQLLSNSDFLQRQCRIYQSIVLLSHLVTSSESSAQSFIARLKHAANVIVELKLNEIDKSTLEDIVAYETPPPMTATDVTLVGACVAQLLVQQIGAIASPPDNESYAWMLCNTQDNFETLVGCL